MKFLLSWLKQFLELSLHPEALAERLTMTGCEVTSLDRVDGDWLFEVEVTPNRPDLLSHLGLAREAAAVLGHKFRFPRWLKRELVLPQEAAQLRVIGGSPNRDTLLRRMSRSRAASYQKSRFGPPPTKRTG